MTNGQYLEIVKERIAKLNQLMEGKRKQYTKEGSFTDRLRSFKTTAILENNSPVKSCWSKFTKHIATLADSIHICESDPTLVDDAEFEEYLNDIHVYLFLLEALIKERKEQYANRDWPEDCYLIGTDRDVINK